MIRVYNFALTVFFAYGASTINTSELTPTNALSVTAEEGDGLTQGRLRVNAATNVDTDERMHSFMFMSSFFRIIDHIPVLRSRKDEYDIILSQMKLSKSIFSKKDLSLLKSLYKLVDEHNHQNPEVPYSAYKLMRDHLNLLEMNELMNKSKGLPSADDPSSELFRLFQDEKEYWKDRTDAGNRFAEAWEINKSDTVKQSIAKAQKLEILCLSNML